MYNTENEDSFINAAKEGNLEEINKILDPITDQKERDDLIHFPDDWAFAWAIINNHDNVISRLIELTPVEAKLQKMFNCAFGWAAENGHIEAMDKLLELSKAHKVNPEIMIHSQNDSAWTGSTGNGHIQIMEKLLTLTTDPVKREKMIHEQYDDAFVLAAGKGKIHAIDKLLELTSDSEKREKMIHSLNDSAFTSAIRNGHTDTLIYLFSLVNSDKINKFIPQILLKMPEAEEEYLQSEEDNEVEIKKNFDAAKSLISKLKPTRIFVNEISNFMQTAKNPFDKLITNDKGQNKNLLINAFYQSSSVRDELTFQDAEKIIDAMSNVRKETLGKPTPTKIEYHRNFVEKLKDKLSPQNQR